MPLYVNAALDIDSTPLIRIWTGPGEITVDGQTYVSGEGVVDIGGVESSQHIDTRASFSFPVVDGALRGTMLAGTPAVAARIWLILSEDYATFHRLLQIEGIISKVTVENLQATAQIETPEGDVERGRRVNISHETQTTEFPGDNGLIDAAELEKGLPIRW